MGESNSRPLPGSFLADYSVRGHFFIYVSRRENHTTRPIPHNSVVNALYITNLARFYLPRPPQCGYHRKCYGYYSKGGGVHTDSSAALLACAT